MNLILRHLTIGATFFAFGGELATAQTAPTPKKIETEVKVAVGQRIVNAARAQIGKTIRYDPSYVSLKYPGGDVPIDRGVCTDVVIRALRTGIELDLQKAVHEDMKKAFSKYPTIWGLKRTDRSIDHRRVPNLKTFFQRRGVALKVTKTAEDYLSGDLVTCTVPPHLPHIMIVSDTKSADGTPLIIHNIGGGAREEDRLFSFELTGHYRLKDAKVPAPKK